MRSSKGSSKKRQGVPVIGVTLCALAWGIVFSTGCGGGEGTTTTVSTSPDTTTIYYPNYFVSSGTAYSAIGLDSHTVQYQTTFNTDSGFGTVGGVFTTGDVGGGVTDGGGSSGGDSGGSTTGDSSGSTSDGSTTNGSTTDGSTTDGSNTGGSDTGGSDTTGTSDSSGTTGDSSTSTSSDSGGVARKGAFRRSPQSMHPQISNGDSVQEQVTFAQQVLWSGAIGDLSNARYGALIFANYGFLDQTSGATLSTSTAYDGSGRPLALASLRTGLRMLFDYPAPQKITIYVLDSNANLIACSAGVYNAVNGLLSLSAVKLGTVVVPASLLAMNPFETSALTDAKPVAACKGQPYFIDNGGCASDATFSSAQVKLVQSLAAKLLGPSTWGHLLDNSLQFGSETAIQSAFGTTAIDLAPLMNDASQGLGSTSYFNPGYPGVSFAHVPQTFAAPGRRSTAFVHLDRQGRRK